MRLILITLTVFLVSCGHHESSIDQTLVTVPTPLPNIYIDERGNSIKQDGWLPPDIKFGPVMGTSTGTAKQENGESVSTVMVHRPVLDTIIEAPSAHPVVNERYSPSKVIRSTSIATTGDKPYCYILDLIRLEPPGSNDNSWIGGPLVMKYCDSDGDGIFETTSKIGDPVPNWALSK